MLPIQEFINHFVKIWDSCSDTFPHFEKHYSPQDQLDRENKYEIFQQKINELQSRKTIKQLRVNPGQTIFPIVKSFIQTVFDFEKQHLELIITDEFKEVSKDFFYRARAFGPELKPENIYQGMRNVWIMNGVQILTGVPIKVTPSVFAYSMIYPYSDNYLDNPDITNIQKQQFSARFSQRLHGERVIPESFTEEQLFKLVNLFEEEFPRILHAKVYESLYAIHKGQTNSLKMINANGLDSKTIQNICFEKGGASVLADGYLVAGKLTSLQERALFGFGIYLQLLDDIQDLNEDKSANTKTMFSYLPKNELGSFINKTIHFGRIILDDMRCFSGQKHSDFLALMQFSIEKMLIESVGLNHNWYEQNYINELEKYSPLSFEFVRQKKSVSKSQRFTLFKKYFNTIMVDQEPIKV